MIDDTKIKGFKLLNGMEVIASIENVHDEILKLNNAICWQLVQVAEDKYDIQFIPLSVGAKFSQIDPTHAALDIDLYKTCIAFSYDLRDEVRAKYKQYISPIILVNP